MAEAIDRTTTPNRISWDDALTRTGSSEALLSWLRQVPVLAWHQGLYNWPSCGKRSGPGDINPGWWSEVRVDPDTGRLIFKIVGYRIFYVDDPAPPAADPLVEVFAFGIELERGVVEVRFPLRPEPERVEPPEPIRSAERKLLGPTEWLAEARKDHPQRRNEGPTAYARRLHPLMLKAEEAEEVTKAWALTGLLRRLHDK